MRDHRAEVAVEVSRSAFSGQRCVKLLCAGLHQLLQMVAMIGDFTLDYPAFGDVRDQQDRAYDAATIAQRKTAQINIERLRLVNRNAITH